MAEVIGALSASIHLAEVVFQYCKALRSASLDAVYLGQQVAAVSQVLQMLRDSLEHPPAGVSFQRTSSLLSSIEDCRKQLSALEDILAACTPAGALESLWKRATWPLKLKDTQEAVKTLHRYVQIFHFATTADGL